MQDVFLRSLYNYDRDAVSNETGLRCDDPSLAQQHQRDEADINVLVRKFGISGVMPMNPAVPMYGDFTGISDYRTALHAVMDANRMFSGLPSELRKRFSNDPEQYVEFCLNPANRDELVKLGLIKPEAVVPATPATPPPVTPPVEGGK